MRYLVTGKDEKTGEPSELIVDAPDREAAFAEAARLGLIGEDARFEPLPYEPKDPPVRYAELRFCGVLLVVLSWVQAIVGVVMVFSLGWPGLITALGAVVPAAMGFACLALRDIAIHSVPADASL